MATMIRYPLMAMAITALASQAAQAQIDKYDPTTGKYVTSDPFAPPATDPSPNRINRRISPAAQSMGAPGGPQTAGAAAGGTSVAGSGSTAGSTGSATPDQQFVTMGDMAMYGAQSSSDDPFAKPDWWPQ
ncbi:hypothetical protein HZF05_13580 [Sphingomonas sp. CGMCC 1.13654]|uniref:Uncharacterized protein n=1 Tax=Sphingomonas chungangi TaxID=2683589 RepID=A0A838L6L2_9SPHN|nr:hypothetical protein [Sphingomonas chungangi]MBA2935123.1 hypothetical protein [Sphingomonas chungangi]MVW57043.1 hypothetical protein [Sphingomonas chungangi]